MPSLFIFHRNVERFIPTVVMARTSVSHSSGTSKWSAVPAVRSRLREEHFIDFFRQGGVVASQKKNREPTNPNSFFSSGARRSAAALPVRPAAAVHGPQVLRARGH